MQIMHTCIFRICAVYVSIVEKTTQRFGQRSELTWRSRPPLSTLSSSKAFWSSLAESRYYWKLLSTTSDFPNKQTVTICLYWTHTCILLGGLRVSNVCEAAEGCAIPEGFFACSLIIDVCFGLRPTNAVGSPARCSYVTLYIFSLVRWLVDARDEGDKCSKCKQRKQALERTQAFERLRGRHVL